MPSLRDFLPPILARAFVGGAASPARKDLLMAGDLQYLPGISQFLNPDMPHYGKARQYTRMAQEGYAGNVYLYRGVRLITEGMAGIPWQLYKLGGKTGRKALDDHPALQLLNVEANEDESGPELLEGLVTYWLLAGVTYLWVVRPDTGSTRPPVKLFAVQPNLLTPDVDKHDGSLIRWIYDVGNGQKQYFAPADVLRVKDFHPLGRLLGLGAAQVAARPLDQHNAANDANTALMQNYMRPSGMLSPKTDTIIPPDAHETLKQDLRERFQGPKNAGRPLVPRAPMQWQAMGVSPLEMDWLNGKTQAAKEIAVALGVPPVLLEDKDNATYNNLKEAHRALMTETILPRMDRLKASLSRFLLPMYGLDPHAYTFDYDRDAIEALSEDEDARHTRVRADYAGGLVSLNEAREALHLDTIDEGDVFLAPPRALTLDQLLEGANMPALPNGNAGAKPPMLPHPAEPAALPAGQIVDANPANPANPAAPPADANSTPAAKSLAVMPPFAGQAVAVASPSLRAKRLAREAARTADSTP